MTEPRLERLLRYLSARGPANAATLTEMLGVSQPTFSRLINSARQQIVVAGRGRATRYAARRTIDGVPASIPVYEVRPPGHSPRQLLTLDPISPAGFLVTSDEGEHFYDDLPWFLADLHPSGFLGRLVPRLHPELPVPTDIRLWSGDHTLRYLCNHGWDLPGALIVGDASYAVWMAQAQSPAGAINASERTATYQARAVDALEVGAPGSSAAGEQPKFLATVQREGSLTPVLVKFSPVVDGAVSQRVSDLLVAEHLALCLLRERGVAAARSALLMGGGRTFLEVERFDRGGVTHRLGACSLQTLDAEYLGSYRSSWPESVASLAAQGVVEESVVQEVQRLALFGRLIGNTDMHFGNLSFTMDGLAITGLAPAYDMLPMLYSPIQGELPTRAFSPSMPGPALVGVAGEVMDAAALFWRRVADDTRCSAGFRGIAAENAQTVAAMQSMVALLPVR